MKLLSKIQYDQNWNIGFCEQTSEELIHNKILKPIQWLKHPYRDRWFADPFILNVTDSEIVVFVEECPTDNPKGIICELVIDRKTMKLKERHMMLELDTHLSYPAIIRHEGKVYVYPENGASGKLNIYEYDSANHRLINPICILNEAVADATILTTDNGFCLIATKYPETQEKSYLYKSESLFGPYKQVYKKPYQTKRSYSRPGGNWIKVTRELFRPAQDCSKRYGGALTIMQVNYDNNHYTEQEFCRIDPLSFRYSRGVHTINFHDRLCVVDGYGYLYQIIGRFFDFLKSIKDFTR